MQGITSLFMGFVFTLFGYLEGGIVGWSLMLILGILLISLDALLEFQQQNKKEPKC